MIWFQTLVGPLVKIPVMPIPEEYLIKYELHHCSDCGEDKPISEFSERRSGNLRSLCNACRYKRYKKKTVAIEYPEKCAYCGKPLNQKMSGKPLKYCSQKCCDSWWVLKKRQDRMKNAS